VKAGFEFSRGDGVLTCCPSRMRMARDIGRTIPFIVATGLMMTIPWLFILDERGDWPVVIFWDLWCGFGIGFLVWFTYRKVWPERAPLIFDRRADRLSHGPKEICTLGRIHHIRIEAYHDEGSWYTVCAALVDGQVRELGWFASTILDPREAEAFAREIANFVGVPIESV
jgi:hypothetical protein